MKAVAVLWLLTLVAACAADPALQSQIDADNAARDKAYIAELGAKCERYGFRPGTDGYADCIRQEDICAQRASGAQRDYSLALMREAGRPGGGDPQRAAQQSNLAMRTCR